MIKSLTHSTYLKIGIIIDTPQDETLVQMSLLVQSFIELLVLVVASSSSDTIIRGIQLAQLLIAFWQEIRGFVHFLFDVVGAVEYTVKVCLIVGKSISYGVGI